MSSDSPGNHEGLATPLQPGLLTALIECLTYMTVLLEYMDFMLQLQGTTNIWVSLCSARPTLGCATGYYS